MLKRFLLVIIATVCYFDFGTASSSSSSSSDELEDGFHVVEHTNRGAECLFPEKFTTEQMYSFFDKKPVRVSLKLVNGADESFEIPVGTISPSPEFYSNVMPNSFQILTGTAAKYAGKIRFTKAIEVQKGILCGHYEYCSSYESLYKMAGYGGALTFPMQLVLDESYKIYNLDKIQGRCKIFNMRESVLGDKDFISSKNQLNPANMMLPDACLYRIKKLDGEWVDGTGCMERIAGNTGTWLLLLQELQGRDIFGQLQEIRRAAHGVWLLDENKSVSDEIRDPAQQKKFERTRQRELNHFLENAVKEHLETLGKQSYARLLEQHGFVEGEMNFAKYKQLFLKVRQDIFTQLGITEDDIPNVPREEADSIIQGKIFFAVSDENAK